MVVREFTLPRNISTPIKDSGIEWVQGWHGYYKMKQISEFEDSINSGIRKDEIDCFLSVLKEIDKDEVNLLELGAGWAEWCLALAGVVTFGLVPHRIKKFNYLAVEGEPYYCELIKKHFQFNLLPVHVLNAAVSDKNGYCYFDKFSGDRNYFDTWCTQGMTFGGNIAGSRLKTFLMAAYRLFRREIIRVPMYDLTTICDMYVFYPDIVHMDIEGIELKVVKSSKYFPKYWIIGTHHKYLNQEILSYLSEWYECLINIYPSKDKVMGLNQDGLQLFRRKN